MKTLQQIFDIIESKNISIDKYEENNTLCGYEINTYTDGGVNQILFIDFRDSDLNPKNASDFITKFSERVESINIDEEIEINRQDLSYKTAFTLSQALKDFKKYKKGLQKIIKDLIHSL